MLDIRRIRENKDEVIAAVNRRGTDYTQAIEDVLKIDEERRALASKIDTLKAEQNKDSKLIPQYKKEGKDTTELMAEMKKLADEIKEGAAEVSRLEKLQEDMLLMISNTPDATVPDGKDDSDNVELRRWGEPTKFDFEPKAHWDLGKELDILDP